MRTFAAVLVLCASCASSDSDSETIDELGLADKGPPSESTDPLYFIAVHCDPYDDAKILEHVDNLRTMIAAADERNIKLTLMFTAQWANVITADPALALEVKGWGKSGHELAGHHHSINHPGTWDGYSDFDEAKIEAAQGPKGKLDYVGTLDDWDAAVRAVVPKLTSGCANAEIDKGSMPDAIVVDSCPGVFTTTLHPVGAEADGGAPEAGRNDFVLVSDVAGIERRFLNHGLISSKFADDAWAAFQAMDGGVYGAVVHTNAHDIEAVESWMDRLAAHDSGGGSRTLSQSALNAGLPEQSHAF